MGCAGTKEQPRERSSSSCHPAEEAHQAEQQAQLYADRERIETERAKNAENVAHLQAELEFERSQRVYAEQKIAALEKEVESVHLQRELSSRNQSPAAHTARHVSAADSNESPPPTPPSIRHHDERQGGQGRIIYNSDAAYEVSDPAQTAAQVEAKANRDARAARMAAERDQKLQQVLRSQLDVEECEHMKTMGFHSQHCYSPSRERSNTVDYDLEIMALDDTLRQACSPRSSSIPAGGDDL